MGIERNARRGGVLLVTVLATVVLSVLGAALARLAASTNEALDSRIDEKRALFLAEAALAESVTALRAGAGGSVASADLPALLGGGVIWSEATELGEARFRVRATGLAGTGRAAVEAVVGFEENEPLFRHTLHSDEVLTVNEGVSVDSYDSALGSYASQAVNELDGFVYASENGDVASNQGVQLNNDAHVFGDATPGPGHSVSMSQGAYVSGSTDSSAETFEFPTVPVPDLPQDGSLVVPPLEQVTLTSGQYGFQALEIGDSATLTVQGPARIVVDDFSGLKDAQLTIDARSGPVTFYVQGAYTHQRGFEAVAAQDSPMAVAFMISMEQEIVFPAYTNVRGAYYAPTSSIMFSNMNEAWGAFGAGRIEMSNDMRFHFDEVLMDHWESDGSFFDEENPVDAWVRAAVEPAALERDRRDPFTVLGLEPSDLPAPGEAWQP